MGIFHSGVRIAGTGSFVPAPVVTNELIAALIARREPGKGAAWAYEKLGIRERRFMSALDEETGRPNSCTDEIDMAEAAARQAIESSGLLPHDIHGLWYVSCTQTQDRQHFSAMAYELHRRLALPEDAVALEMDAGCGGAVHAIIYGRRLLSGSGMGNLLIVASNGPSTFYADWEAYVDSGAWLSMYIFGDGAGAVLLESSTDTDTSRGILETYAAIDPTQRLMEFRPVPGAHVPVYYIDGRAVAATFGTYARAALLELQKRKGFRFSDIDRFYFHQVNGRVLQRFVDDMGIPSEKVATHVERYGNMAAAATLVLLDEDRRAGAVRDGDLCIFCTVGAGAQYGAALVCL